MRIVVVGGHGKIGRLLARRLSERGDDVVGLIRNPDHESDLDAVGARSVLVDIEKDGAEAFAAAFTGADAVVFAAGAGPDGRVDRKRTVDYAGSVKSVEAAQQVGVQRFVQISAIGVDEPLPDGTEDVWTAYVEAKRDADEHLRGSSLDWTILRPGGLTDDPATEKVALGERVERGQIPRDDVAALVVACLDEPATIGKQWEVVGGDVPVTEAVKGLV